jgi:hypothetical protein
MKPLNLDNKPCSPISSNCVIWQGPDIPCIKLCTGDTVSDVVAKLATELCTVLDILNVTNYDLSCFNLTACGPNDFQALIQFLIDQICATETQVTVISDPSTSPINTTRSTGADTLVTVAPCFVVGGVTVMTVSQYAQAIGTRVCDLVAQIAALNSQITSLDIRVTALEAAPVPTFTLPNIPVQECDLSATITAPGSYAMDDVLEALINDTTFGFCALRSTTGMPSEILAAVQSQCINDSDISLVFGTPFSTAYAGSWIPVVTVDTLADAINNIWISLCDVYQYVSSIDVNVTDTATINLSVSSGPNYTISANITDTGWVDLNGFAYYSGVTKPQCRRIGNQVHFRGNVYIPLENPASPGSVVPLTSETAYNVVQGCTTWSGAGGCTIIGTGGLQFNNGASVVPTSITSGNFDALYRSGWQTVARQITVTGSNGTALTSMINIFITAAKQLEIQTVDDIEDGTATTPLYGNSLFRFMTSNIRSGEYLPNYIAPASDIQNAPSNANFPLVSNTFNTTWDFNCDAAQASQIGGFEFSLDGMIAYLTPCNTETGLSIVCP